MDASDSAGEITLLLRAQALSVSLHTARCDWMRARAWPRKELD